MKLLHKFDTTFLRQCIYGAPRNKMRWTSVLNMLINNLLKALCLCSEVSQLVTASGQMSCLTQPDVIMCDTEETSFKSVSQYK